MMRNDFAIFIMVYGRPDKDWTYRTLRKSGYTGDIFCVADNTDEALPEYKAKYKERLLVFDKLEAYKKFDSGDNSGDLRSSMYSANTIFDLAKQQRKKYFMIMCDDYTQFQYSFNSKFQFISSQIHRLDDVINGLLEFYINTPTTTIAFAQGGDFMGGKEGSNAEPKLMRKAMNSFLCSTDRPFQFVGRMNEDVTTYVRLGSQGYLFFTTTLIKIIQTMHQSQASGLTDMYLDYGTYVKSFFSVMYNPSCIKISQLGTVHKRIHHKIDWSKVAPKILRQ